MALGCGGASYKENAPDSGALASPADDSDTLRQWHALAAEHQLVIVGGFCERGPDGRLFNSAALVDASGNVIGMDAAAQVSGRFAQSSGSTNAYAIPIDAAMSVVKMIRAGGGSSPNIHVGDRALLGVSVQDGSSSGALVVGVQSGSPAESAGLAAGDAIISVGGANVTSAGTLTVAMQARHPGDRVAVSWLDAAGNQHDATVALIAGPPA